MPAASCLLARAKLAQFVAKLKESSTAEKAGTLIKAGYLLSLKTVERNDVGNAAMGGVEYLATRPLAVAMDYLGAVAKSAATFGKVKPHELRQIANTLNVGGLAQGAKGIREGTAKAVQLIRTGVDADRVAEKFEHGETTFANPVLDKAVHGVFNFLEANDKPFFGFALQTSLYGRARLLGIREGLRGAALSKRVNELLASPTEEMVLGATNDAMYATFKNPTALSEAAAGVRTAIRQKAAKAEPGRKLGYAGAQLFLDTTIPFTKVASAIANAGIDYSPAGFAKALIQAADRDPKVQAQLSQQLSRATIGTGLVMLGYAMANNGTLTGASPTNPGEKAQQELEGKQPNSINLDGKWRSITFLGPLAIPLLMGAGLRKFSGSKDDTGLGAKALYGVGSIGKTMTEQSYLQGLSNVIDALNDPANKGKSAIAGMVPVPSILSQAAGAVDPVRRQSETIGEKIQAKIPFASRALAPRINQFGDTSARTSGGLRGAAESLLDITNPRADQSTAITHEMDRLGVNVNTFARALRLPTGTVRRTITEQNAVLQEFGPIKRDALAALMKSTEYQQATDDERKAAIESVLRDVQHTGTSVDKARRLGISVPKVRTSDVLGVY